MPLVYPVCRKEEVSMPYIPEFDAKHCHLTQWPVEGKVFVVKADQKLGTASVSQERRSGLAQRVKLDK